MAQKEQCTHIRKPFFDSVRNGKKTYVIEMKDF